MFRRKNKPAAPVSFDVIPARWRGQVEDCIRLGDELTRLSASAAGGAVQERLAEFAATVRGQLDDIVASVTRSAELLRLTETLNVEEITDAYKRARRQDPDGIEAESLGRQHASAQRLLNSLDDVDTHVAAAQLRIRELVLAAGELALSGSDAAMASVSSSVGRLAGEADALREALAALRPS